jgi:Co/Zn/Cd efflux system component
VALLIGYESVLRILAPITISFNEAIAIAVAGLVVNIFSAFLLREDQNYEFNLRQSTRLLLRNLNQLINLFRTSEEQPGISYRLYFVAASQCFARHTAARNARRASWGISDQRDDPIASRINDCDRVACGSNV